MKKFLFIFFVCFTALSVFSCKRPAAQEELKLESSGAAPVQVVKVQKQSISEKLNYSGLVEAVRKANITPDVGGKIARIYVQEGDHVIKGQLLAELDTRAIRLQLEQAKASQAVAEANFKDAKRNRDRMNRLSLEKAVSDQQVEKIKLAFEAAEAHLQQARAALNLARHQLDVSIMRAPFAGVIAAKNAEVGDVINPMMRGLGPASGVLTLMDFAHVKVYVDIPLKEIVNIKKGQSASLRVSAFPDKTFPGKVAAVNLTADPMTRKFRVEIDANNPDRILRPNIFGQVTIDIRTQDNVLVVPQKALLENSYVFLAENGHAVKRQVMQGLQNAGQVEITNGLKEGDLIIVEGNYGLEEGEPLEIKEVHQ